MVRKLIDINSNNNTFAFLVCEKDEECPKKSLCYKQAPFHKMCVWVQQPDGAGTKNQCLLPSNCNVHKGFNHCVSHPKIKSEQEDGRCAKVTPVLKKQSGLDYVADTFVQLSK